ncbi:phosphotransferase [Jiangella asiatica]|uniref:Aminoglycoside phosphotransferase family protein n=1 Tax=Jiangella asiatica TaxID=2530372 RepID=A0A4R5DRX5_9ACTN|nr:phosphotransferase [Jiangella asiatica]TDE15000.1 aminoglycoside phosphotransferase family protein [Jiangella asiatica]
MAGPDGVRLGSRGCPTDKRLRSWVRDDFGVELTALGRVDGGADTTAAVWRGATADGSRYAVKWSGGGSPAGLRVSSRLAELGVPGVAAPVRTRSGGLWTEREGRRLSLLPWVSDTDGLDGRMAREQWQAFGSLLARVHGVVLPDRRLGDLPAEGPSPTAVASAIREVGRRLDTVDAGDDDLVLELVAAWRSGMELVTSLLARTASLARTLRDRPRPPAVVCHTDAHLGNVLVGAAGRVWLIDWDDAALAPRERDLMFAVGGLPGFAPVGRREQEWFFAGYGPADVDRTRLAYYRCVRALDDIAQLAAEVLDPDGDDRERARWLRYARGELDGAGLAGLALAE